MGVNNIVQYKDQMLTDGLPGGHLPRVLILDKVCGSPTGGQSTGIFFSDAIFCMATNLCFLICILFAIYPTVAYSVKIGELFL